MKKNNEVYLRKKREDSEFSLCEWGWEKCYRNKGWKNIADYYVLHYIYKGKGVYKVKDKSYTLSKGTMFVVKPGINNYYQADKDDPWAYYWVGFVGTKAVELLEKTGIFENDRYYIKVDKPEKISKYMKAIAHTQGKSLSYVCSIMSNLYSIFENLLSNQLEETQENNAILSVRKAVHYISEHYKEDVKVEDIANFVCMERTYFYKVFKNIMGFSPKKYITNFRIQKSIEFLEKTNLTVKEIGCLVGYEDSGTYIRAFKTSIGLSPTEYLCKHNNDKLDN